MISERPTAADNRAVPGNWEGDPVIGKDGRSAIYTLVERSTRLVMLLHLPDGTGAEAVADAITDKITTPPAVLRRSLTWDRVIELARHAEITFPRTCLSTSATRTTPGSAAPTRTPTACRQNFPKGTDLSDARHRPPGLRRRPARRPPPQGPRLQDTGRSPRPTTLQRSTSWCCDDQLNPPPHDPQQLVGDSERPQAF
jgi:hypothetical protein